MTIKLGVLISGSGTNLQAILDAIDAGKLDASVEIVIASNQDAYGIKRAEAAGIPTMALHRKLYDTPLAADEVIAAELKRVHCNYVVMAGYMRKVHKPILSGFKDSVINLHPALLPSFKGAHAIKDAFWAGVKVTGVTVHFANENYDDGPIIAQRAVEILPDDTISTLEERIHEVEHVLYPEVLQMIAEGRVHIVTNEKKHRCVIIDPA